MKQIQKTSLLICLTVLIMIGAAGLVVKWPVIQGAFSQWLAAIQEQPVEPEPKRTIGADPFSYDPPLPSLVKDLHPVYRIQAALHTNEAKITGTMTLEFDNPETSDLRLFLYDYTWSPITVTSIRQGENSLPFQRRNAVITMPNSLKGEKRISLTVAFETVVPRGGTRFGVRDDIWTLTGWYPMLGAVNPQGEWYEPPARISFGDPFVYHYADYEITFNSPEGYRWVTSWGIGDTRALGNGRQESRYRAKHILNFSLVGSPLYHIETITAAPGLQVDIASTSKENVAKIKTIAEAVFPAYIEAFGPLPYPRVGIAETNTFTHAMEYGNLAIFRRNLFNDASIDHWLPHEIAHLWWYNSVGTLEARHGWVDEGLVELSVYYYRLKRYGTAAADSLLREYQADVDRLNARYPYGKLAKQLNQFATNDEFNWTWYAKGAMLYDQLRRSIGDERFRQFLQRVHRTYHGQFIGAEHLDQALSQTLQGEARFFVPNAQALNRQGILPLQLDRYVTTVLNGVTFYPDVPARKRGDTIYLPLRDVMEKLGYRVEWAADLQAVRLQAGGHDLLVKERSRQVAKNGKSYTMAAALTEIDNRTMVPLEFFDRVLGYRVEYLADTHTVKITVPSAQES